MRARVVVLAGAVLAAGCSNLFNLERVGAPADASTSDESPPAIEHIAGADIAEDTHATTVGVTLSAVPAVGNMVIVSVATYECTIASITDSAGNSYTRTSGSPVSSPASAVAIWLAPVTAVSDPFAITVRATPLAADPEVSITADVYTGLAPVSQPLDEDGHITSFGTVEHRCGTVMTGPEPTLVYVALIHDAIASATAGEGFTRRHEPTTSNVNTVPIVVADRIVAQSQEIMPTFVLDSSSPGACDTIVLR